MRRMGTVLLSVAAALLVVPVPAAAAVDCAPTTLPVLPGTTGGGSGSAILDTNTFLGWMNDPYQGVIWRDGSVSSLDIVPDEVNPSGLVSGAVWNGQPRAARMQLGGTPEVGSTRPSHMEDVNSAGDSVGWQSNLFGPPSDYDALWWKRGDAGPTLLPGPYRTSAGAIDDLGNMLGYGETTEGERRYIVWGPDGTVKRQFGPYITGQTRLSPTDIDDGIAVADRRPPSGEQDITLIDVDTGTVTPIAGSSGWTAMQISNGSVLAQDADITLTYRLWHNGVTYNLPSPPNMSSSRLFDLDVLGSTAVVVGFSYPDGPGFFQTPVVWRCG